MTKSLLLVLILLMSENKIGNLQKNLILTELIAITIKKCIIILLNIQIKTQKLVLILTTFLSIIMANIRVIFILVPLSSYWSLL